MVQRRGQLGLGHEPPPEAFVARQVLGQDPQGDRAVEREVRRAVDDAHPATADPAVDAVAREHLLNERIRHRAAIAGARRGAR